MLWLASPSVKGMLCFNTRRKREVTIMVASFFLCKKYERGTRQMEIAIALVSSITTLAVCLVNNYFQMKRMRVEQKQITESQLESIKLGVQSLLRDRLLWEYEKWEDRGYCPYDKKQNIENMHTQYANLGKNGVMDEAHAHFMKLPLEQPATNN